MENTNQTDVSQWVDGQMAALGAGSDWQPDTDRALERLRDRMVRRSRRRLWNWVAAPVSAAFILLFVLPVTFAIAQRLWDRASLSRSEVVRLNVDGRINLAEAALPLTYAIPPQPPHPVAGLAEAGREVGFTPKRLVKLSLQDMFRMIRQDPLGAPFQIRSTRPWTDHPPVNFKWKVSGPVIAQTRIQAASLNAALRSAGVEDVSVPQAWDGAIIGVQISPTVLAEFDDGLVFAQSLPYTFVTPTEVAKPEFVEVVLRILGLPASKAGALRERFADNPAFFLFIPPEAEVQIHEVPLSEGSGLLLRKAGEGLTLIWSTSDRMYVLKGKLGDDQAIGLAYSIK